MSARFSTGIERDGSQTGRLVEARVAMHGRKAPVPASSHAHFSHRTSRPHSHPIARTSMGCKLLYLQLRKVLTTYLDTLQTHRYTHSHHHAINHTPINQLVFIPFALIPSSPSSHPSSFLSSLRSCLPQLTADTLHAAHTRH
jgi:hypothetical protein